MHFSDLVHSFMMRHLLSHPHGIFSFLYPFKLVLCTIWYLELCLQKCDFYLAVKLFWDGSSLGTHGRSYHFGCLSTDYFYVYTIFPGDPVGQLNEISRFERLNVLVL